MVEPLTPERYLAFLELYNRLQSQPLGLRDLLQEEIPAASGKVLKRFVALWEDAVVGHAWAVHYPSQGTGTFEVQVAVDPAFRNQGLGHGLYQALLQVAQVYQAHTLSSEVLEDAVASLAFALKRGFRVRTQQLGLQLDLEGFKPANWPQVQALLQAHRLRLSSYAQEGDNPAHRQKLYAINRIATTHDPANQGGFPTFAVWERLIPQSAGFEPAGQFLLVAPNGEYVGLSAVEAQGDRAQTLLTGLHPAYRGLGLAKWLKHAVLAWAKSQGVKRVFTEVNVQNAAMLAINESLGFVRSLGRWLLQKDL